MLSLILSIVDSLLTVSINVIEIIREFAVALAGAFGAGGILALLGFRVWRKQLKTRTEYDLARRLLKAVYRVRNVIPMVRRIFTFGEEHIQAVKEIKEIEPEFYTKDPEHDPKVTDYVYQIRARKLNERFSDLEVEAVEAEVLWNDQIKEVLNPLRECVQELCRSMEEYLWYRKEKTHSAEEQERFNQLRDIVFDPKRDPAEDPFKLKLESAIENIRSYLKQYLKI